MEPEEHCRLIPGARTDDWGDGVSSRHPKPKEAGLCKAMIRRVLRLGLGAGLPNRGLRTRRGGFTLGKAEGSSRENLTVVLGSPKPPYR